MISYSASATSNSIIGYHMSDVTGPPSSPASCRGKHTTGRIDASTPSQASPTGIMRPRRRSHEKSVLPMAKKAARGEQALSGAGLLRR